MTLAERDERTRSQIHAAKRRYWSTLGRDPNVLGIATGQRVTDGRNTGQPALVVYVARKLPARLVPLARLLPRQVSVEDRSVEVDVVESGPIYPMAFALRERPAPAGISIGHVAVTTGTLGGLVVDDTDGSLCILSNI